MTPEEEKEVLDKHTALCEGCGKRRVLPNQADDLYVAGKEGMSKTLREAATDLHEGVYVRICLLTEEKVWVCPSRYAKLPSDNCRVATLRKKSRCPMCGAHAKDGWPLPCAECEDKCQETNQRRKIAETCGDSKAVWIRTKIEGLHPRYEDGPFGPKLQAVFKAFGLLPPISGDPITNRIGWEVSTYGSDEELTVVMNETQFLAVQEMMRWLNSAAAHSMIEAVRRGANILDGLLTGKLTVDAMNERVLEGTRHYREIQAKLGKEPR